MSSHPSIGHYLLTRLYESGVHHVFGVPGDYILRFYQQLSRSPIQHIGTTREDTAAFATDAYARCRGLGAMAVTYGVGALSVVNAVAGAYAESSPVVVISGAPGIKERHEHPLLHHRFGPFRFQHEIFERITCAVAVLDDPYTAFRQIDRALAAAREHCKPVYIELPRDRVDVEGYSMPSESRPATASDAGSLNEAVEETLQLLGKAASPVLVAGVELHRRGLQDKLLNLVDKAHLPVAATLTGKSVLGERHPYYLGIYEGAMGSTLARDRVEQSDFLLMLGVTMNDIDLGIFTAKLDANRVIRATQDEVIIHHHRYPHVLLGDFVTMLNERMAPRPEIGPAVAAEPATFDFPVKNQPMKVARLIARLNRFLTPDMAVISDVGDCLFAAIDLRVHENSEFLASAYYTTMGFAVPAALGAQIANPTRRTLVLVGDGAFQMTGTELSTIARFGLNPIVIIFNNCGYSTERYILDGPFNDIACWQFERLGEVFGPLTGYSASTEDEFEDCLNRAFAQQSSPSLINVHLSKDDPSPAMRGLAERLGKRV
ncbi:alpha-keto acid decarboxylase family protein [Methylobacter sp. sgz302048]|uniref:alpha-keto acid decarboxylase family protein n=1 Tax=Methylobacter sp. sgz302048 TaxID=3455945 RepID=UPI003FA031D5